MAKDETKKRVSLYFNLEDPDEKLMFSHLSKRKKSQYIKNLILNDIKKIGVIATTVADADTLDDVDLDSNEIDFDN